MSPTTAHHRTAGLLRAPAPAHLEHAALAEAVEVRMDGEGHLSQPGQLLWQGRLWLVRHALRLAAVGSSEVGPDGTGEAWRLLVGHGPAGQTGSVVVVHAAGGWLLHRDAS